MDRRSTMQTILGTLAAGGTAAAIGAAGLPGTSPNFEILRLLGFVGIGLGLLGLLLMLVFPAKSLNRQHSETDWGIPIRDSSGTRKNVKFSGQTVGLDVDNSTVVRGDSSFISAPISVDGSVSGGHVGHNINAAPKAKFRLLKTDTSAKGGAFRHDLLFEVQAPYGVSEVTVTGDRDVTQITPGLGPLVTNFQANGRETGKFATLTFRPSKTFVLRVNSESGQLPALRFDI